MAWFLRAVETPEGGWLCRFGLQDLDEHDSLSGALDHLAQVALEHDPSVTFVHRLDGTVQRVGDG
jgi:hypothetical protein